MYQNLRLIRLVELWIWILVAQLRNKHWQQHEQFCQAYVLTKKKRFYNVKRVTEGPTLIRNYPVYPAGEWLRGHWVT